MPGAAHTHASGIHPFCYGHYTEMRSHEAASSKGRLVYSCQERDCPVQYSRPEGYFLDVENRPLKHWPVPPISIAQRPLPDVLARSEPETALSSLEMPKMQRDSR